jgi:zinc resistance-associated protein
MKKTMLTLAAISLIALIGTQAYACYWDGYWGGPMGGPMAGSYDGNHQAFYDKTARLRQNLAAKQGEYNALLATSNPDPERTAELGREITVLHDQLRAQARTYNLPARNNAGHHGRMGGGYGHGCW